MLLNGPRRATTRARSRDETDFERMEAALAEMRVNLGPHFSEFAREITNDLPAQLQNLLQAFQRAEYETVYQISIRLRGTLSYLSVLNLLELCRDLEQAAQSQDRLSMAHLIYILADSLNELVSVMNGMIAENVDQAQH